MQRESCVFGAENKKLCCGTDEMVQENNFFQPYHCMFVSWIKNTKIRFSFCKRTVSLDSISSWCAVFCSPFHLYI